MNESSSDYGEKYVWIEWTPSWGGSHVKGRYSERTFDGGLPEPQRVECHCEKCGARWVAACTSGSVRSHIAKFAAVHAHKDPLKAPIVQRPGSLRRKVEP